MGRNAYRLRVKALHNTPRHRSVLLLHMRTENFIAQTID